MTWFVDTNIFIRFLTRDDERKAADVERLFDDAEAGRESLLTAESIIAEIVYVMRSSIYEVSREDVADAIAALLDIRGLQCIGEQHVRGAIELFRESRLDFADCLAAAHVRARKLEGIYSYDRGFDAVESLVRREPGDA